MGRMCQPKEMVLGDMVMIDPTLELMDAMAMKKAQICKVYT